MKQHHSNQLFHVLVRKSEHGGLVDLWLATHYDENERDVEREIGFRERQDIFLWALKRLLNERQIKLHNGGAFLEGGIDEQVDAFRRAWPKTESDSGYDDFYWWFFDPDCPAGVAWRQSDGSYLIAD
jgi:hypothetical protein